MGEDHLLIKVKRFAIWLAEPITVLGLLFGVLGFISVANDIGWSFSALLVKVLDFYLWVRGYVFIPLEWLENLLNLGFKKPWKEIFSVLLLYSLAQAFDGFRGSKNKPFRAWFLRFTFGMVGTIVACSVTSSDILRANIDVISLIFLGVLIGMPIHRLGFSFQFALDQKQFFGKRFWNIFFGKLYPIVRWAITASGIFFASNFFFSGHFVEVGNEFGLLLIVLFVLNKSFFHLYMTAKPVAIISGDLFSFLKFFLRYPLKSGDDEFVRLPVGPGKIKLAIQADSGNAYVARHLFAIFVFISLVALGLDWVAAPLAVLFMVTGIRKKPFI